MAWTLDSDRPIFLQIVERIQTDIVSGRYQPGDKLPSVRDLAAEASVNPNTMQKAFAELERTGLFQADQRTFYHGGLSYDRTVKNLSRYRENGRIFSTDAAARLSE